MVIKANSEFEHQPAIVSRQILRCGQQPFGVFEKCVTA